MMAPKERDLMFIGGGVSNVWNLLNEALLDNKIIGSTRFYEIYPEHNRLAIGYTWYIPELWGSLANAECKLLLLWYAFLSLQMTRVEFFVDSRNERSRAAVKKLGAKEEGIMRKHILLEDGFTRDTVIYSFFELYFIRNKPLLQNQAYRQPVDTQLQHRHRCSF